MAAKPVTHDLHRCTNCGIEKPFTAEFFPVDGDRLRRQCRPCRAGDKRRGRHERETPQRREVRLAKAREYQAANREAIAQKQREWMTKNSDHIQDYRRTRYELNKDKIKARARQWRIDNPERKLAANRAWAEANRDRSSAHFRASKQKRRARPAFRMFESVSTQIRSAIRGGKDGRSWEALVGFTRQELVHHLERQFLPGMSWENYGDWHVDHIIPVASFTFETAEDAGFKACWAITNLRPLWAADNLSKSDKMLFLI